MYPKLVRDKIPEKILKRDGRCIYRYSIDGDEVRQLLLDKLLEEVEEFRADPSVEERADIQEVLDEIDSIFGISKSELKQVQGWKREENGGFGEYVVLEGIEDAPRI